MHSLEIIKALNNGESKPPTGKERARKQFFSYVELMKALSRITVRAIRQGKNQK